MKMVYCSDERSNVDHVLPVKEPVSCDDRGSATE